jgi:hypothetical protein
MVALRVALLYIGGRAAAALDAREEAGDVGRVEVGALLFHGRHRGRALADAGGGGVAAGGGRFGQHLENGAGDAQGRLGAVELGVERAIALVYLARRPGTSWFRWRRSAGRCPGGSPIRARGSLAGGLVAAGPRCGDEGTDERAVGHCSGRAGPISSDDAGRRVADVARRSTEVIGSRQRRPAGHAFAGPLGRGTLAAARHLDWIEGVHSDGAITVRSAQHVRSLFEAVEVGGCPVAQPWVGLAPGRIGETGEPHVADGKAG